MFYRTTTCQMLLNVLLPRSTIKWREKRHREHETRYIHVVRLGGVLGQRYDEEKKIAKTNNELSSSSTACISIVYVLCAILRFISRLLGQTPMVWLYYVWHVAFIAQKWMSISEIQWCTRYWIRQRLTWHITSCTLLCVLLSSIWFLFYLIAHSNLRDDGGDGSDDGDGTQLCLRCHDGHASQILS